VVIGTEATSPSGSGRTRKTTCISAVVVDIGEHGHQTNAKDAGEMRRTSLPTEIAKVGRVAGSSPASLAKRYRVSGSACVSGRYGRVAGR
jgi:hypothetical protein